MELRRIIRKILQESVEKPKDFTLGKNIGDKILFKKLGYWARLYKGRIPGLYENYFYWEIYETSSHQLIGRVWEYGKIQIAKTDKNKDPNGGRFGNFENNWGLEDFNGGLNAGAKYIWLQRQKPLTENAKKNEVKFENVPLGKLVIFPDIDGWGAKGNSWNEIRIYSNDGKYAGKLEYDESEKETRIFYGEDEVGNWANIESWPIFGNVKNAVRYVYLQNQKPLIKPYTVDEVTADGRGDLMNYYTENPASLNNDYMDNFYLDSQDYYWPEKTISNKQV